MITDQGRSPRLPVVLALDGLRGVAVTAVLIAHMGEFLLPRYGRWLLPGGFLGVDVFFVLSGFLITGLLAGEAPAIESRRFWARRLRRLVPALALFAAGYLLVTAVAFGDGLDRALRTFGWAFAMVANWQLSFGVQPPLDLLHLWSLSVEAQFYLVAPLVALWAVHRGWTWRFGLAAAVVGIGASATLRALEWEWWADPGKVYTRTGARADALLVGVALALVWRAAPQVVASVGRAAPLAAAGLVAVAWTAHPGDPWLFLGGFTLVAVLTAVVVAGVLTSPGIVGRALAVRPLCLLGRMSYSIYLWHLPVVLWTVRWANDPQSWLGRRDPSALGEVAVVLVLVGITSTASYLLVERPILRRRVVGRPGDTSSGRR